MAKKKDSGGAPAYMGLFTSLMTVMLAFFILLVAMAPTQDAGFYKGIGSVKNALGLTGGYGLMDYAKYAGDKGALGLEPEGEALGDDSKQMMLNVEGGRGVGTVDIEDVEQVDNGYYISVLIPQLFSRGSAVVERDSDLADYLKKMSIGFLNISDKIIIRSFANDAGTSEENQLLATKRANAMMKYMKNHGMNYDRLTSVGYAYNRYFDFSDIDNQIRRDGQASYFFIYKKKTD
jgi:flagellar motor protein MotB